MKAQVLHQSGRWKEGKEEEEKKPEMCLTYSTEL
jgi:hypothetical protein